MNVKYSILTNHTHALRTLAAALGGKPQISIEMSGALQRVGQWRGQALWNLIEEWRKMDGSRRMEAG